MVLVSLLAGASGVVDDVPAAAAAATATAAAPSSSRMANCAG